MNYYRRYLGDYMRDTMHLSIMEHGAYTLLLDACYATEKPLPADFDALFRICRAMSKPEQEAVKRVAEEFFKIADDGFRHNRRADIEIGIGQATIEKQRKSGIESASKRWSTDGLTHSSSGKSAIQPPTTNHQPLSASLHPPASNQKSKTLSDSAAPNPDAVHPKPLNGFKTQAVEILDFLNSTAGKKFRQSKANLDLIRCRLEDGITADQLRKVIVRQCREWLPDDNMRRYLRPETLFGRMKCEQYVGELVPPSEVKHEL